MWHIICGIDRYAWCKVPKNTGKGIIAFSGKKVKIKI
jgi:hypothetical protein